MAFTYDGAIGFKTPWTPASHGAAQTILYALSVGFGQDGADEALDFVYEGRGPKVLPTLATVLVKSISRDLGLDMAGVVHAAQRLDAMAPIPPAASIVWQAAVTQIIDKGPGKGALVAFDTTARLAEDGPDLFVLRNTLFARHDGGCGGPATPSPARDRVPERPADVRHTIPTRVDQAMLYRLNGDSNPLHIDPAAARKAGFAKPILHGLCTYGIACRAIVETVCAFDPARIARLEGRFTAPVHPGDAITTEIWIDGADLMFRCLAQGAVAIDDGVCRLTDLPRT
jgi:acyl dehydratase